MSEYGSESDEAEDQIEDIQEDQEDFNQITEEVTPKDQIVDKVEESKIIGEEKGEDKANKEANKTIVYKGIEYQKDFGTLIRSLDRDQAYKNECMRKAFFKSREKELNRFYAKKIDKDIAMMGQMSAAKKEKEYEELESHYAYITEEKILKEWQRQGRTARDWVKTKVVYFDENQKPQALPCEKYREMQKQNKKQEITDAIANSAPKNKKQTDKKFELVKGHIKSILEKFDENENKSVETDCCMCFNLMIESCILPCMHRFCVQCMRTHLNYQTSCPICRAQVPSFFKQQFYFHNVDRNFQKVIKQKFPLEYEQRIQQIMKSRLMDSQRFKFQLEVGHYYNGYENPSNVYDYEQKTVKNEWTVFIRAKNPQMRPIISQFVGFVDFMIPQANCIKTVEAPEQHDNNVQESKSLYSIQTKIERNKFKLTPDNKVISIDICIYFNNKLTSKESFQRPFMFSMPLNFHQKEQLQEMTVSFDQSKVNKHIKIEDFKAKLLNTAELNVKINEENMYDDIVEKGGFDHKVL